MIALLDTHALIWLAFNSARLTPAVRGYLADPAGVVYLSVVSVWEMVIKVGTGKLRLTKDVPTIVAEQLAANPIQILPVTLAHVLGVGGLPSIHRDPFDRMLVAQAQAENAVLLTADPLVRRYPVPTDW